LKLDQCQPRPNRKTQPFWVQGIHIVPNCHTLAGFAIGALHLVTMAKYPPFKKTTQNQNLFLLPNEGRQWRNLQGCDNWVLSGSPEPTMVGFCDLVGVGIGSVSKKRKKTSAREFGLFIKKIDFYLGLIYSKCQAICPVLTYVSSSSFGQK
jgi:hypothetical protein